jgi:hypothetical protein
MSFGPPSPRLCDFAIHCKRCGETIPAPVQTLPDTWIVAACPLCGERRRYVPSEIFRGRLSDRLRPQPGQNEVRPWG